MNKKLVWTIIVIIALIVIGFFIFSEGDDTSSSTSEGQDASAGTQQDNTQIETSEDVLDEIDSAVGYLE